VLLQDNLFFGVSRETASKINQELRAEVSSLNSYASDGSSDEPHESLQRLRDLPPYLWSDCGPIELGNYC